MRDVVRHVAHRLGVQAGQRVGEEGRGVLGVGVAQVVPRVDQADVLGREDAGRVEGVRDGVDVVGPQAGGVEAPLRRELR